MPNVRTPGIRQRKDGRYMVRWGGRDHYLGRDPVEAAQRYAGEIERWQAWRERVEDARGRPIVSELTVMDVCEQFVRTKEVEGGRSLADYYRKHLARFLAIAGPLRADTVRAAHLLDLRRAMVAKGYAPKTVNHDVIACKAAIRWAMDMDMIPYVTLRAARSLPLGPPPDKSLSHAQVLFLIYGSASKNMAAWLAVQYLCVARPTEVLRLVHRQGSWLEDGVFQLDRGKADLVTSQRRCLVVTPRAAAWLALAEPRWTRLDSYSQAVGDVHPYRPGRLRHSAATHLRRAGATGEDIARLLGHVPSRVHATYARPDYSRLRSVADRLIV